MALNSIMAVILRYFTAIGRFCAIYITVVEVRPILSIQMWAKESSFRHYNGL